MKILFLIVAMPLLDSGGAESMSSSSLPAGPGNAGRIGVWGFLGGQLWQPANNIFSILPMIMRSIYMTARGNYIVGVPIRLFTACVINGHYCPETGSTWYLGKTAVNTDGRRALQVYVWILRRRYDYSTACQDITGQDGSTMHERRRSLLGIMILPTISQRCGRIDPQRAGSLL